MSTDPFAAPGAASGGIDWAAVNGSLILITVHDVETDIQTSFGAKDAVRADVAILDGDHAGEEYGDSLIFPKVLISQLRGSKGSKVLGRLGQGEAKKGQQPPWLLAEASEADKKVGVAYLSGTLTPPTTAAGAPPF